MNFDEYFSTKVRNDYQRDNFDVFLKKVGFKYDVPSVHIAGTNGKGSTATYIAYSLMENGLKVGLFNSPYLINVNEMISINGIEISDKDIEETINEYSKFINKFNLSAFEIQTFIALNYFKKNKCDVAVIECGMGGEVDATNVFTPILSIITSVSLEHTGFLGRTISEIAQQKCGIIKERVPVVLGTNDEDAVKVAFDYANDLESKIYSVVEPSNVTLTDDGYKFDYANFKDVKISSSALYSVKDCCIALEALNILKNTFTLDNSKINSGIVKVNMPARMSIVNRKPMVVIDGGHNPEAISRLVESLAKIADNRPIHTIFAAFRDKNIERMLAMLGEISKDITLTTFNHQRARTYEEYFLFAEDYKFNEDAFKTIEEAIKQYPDDIILITGSLAFAGLVKDAFDKGAIKCE